MSPITEHLKITGHHGKVDWDAIGLLLSLLALLGGALAGKQLVNTYFTLFGSNPNRWQNCLHFSILGNFSNAPGIVGKSSAHPVGVFSMLPNPPECHIGQKSIRCNILRMK
jgi:hypothetical protein